MMLGLFVINLLNIYLIFTSCHPMGEEVESEIPATDVQIVMGTKLKTNEKITMPLVPAYSQTFVTYHHPAWRASAYLIPESGRAAMKGVILFHQYMPNQFIRVTVNISGLPPGRHAIHIHSFGDISQGCKSAGLHMPNNFVGNVEAREDGVVSTSFYNAFLIMFGNNGILGRSVVIHSNPINQSRHPDVFSTAPLMSPVDELSYENEEKVLGRSIMCGVVTITNNREK